jgi:molybdate transport system substrate-binding protein
MHRRIGCLALLLSVLGVISSGSAAQPQPLLVFAASSLTDVLNELGPQYTQQTGQPVKLSFAASSALARQIEAGAQADVFFSADTDWMDYLQKKALIDTSTRRTIVGNRLALIAPDDSKLSLQIRPGFALAAALGSGRLATGDPDSVPVGRYAKAALSSLGVWDSVSGRIAPAENVRTALEYVARGEATLGIVYQTDALIEKRVRVVDVFPADSHPPITYPAAVVASAKAGSGLNFVKFLQGKAAQTVFHRYGFTTAP